MKTVLSRILFVTLFGAIVVRSYDEVDLGLQNTAWMKILRDMANQTKADTLNLPANATSIRENITDTFSCENKTYGYYADVDNDCQVFHVCLPSQMPSGRSITYRYSFICPEETLFNQEVLVCTRSIDSIDCADAPLFYHVNDDIGKVQNKTNEPTNEDPANPETLQNTPTEMKEEQKRQSMLIDNLIKRVVNDELRGKLREFAEQHTGIIPEDPGLPRFVSEVIEEETGEEDLDDAEERIALERSIGRRGRGMLRFKADV